MSNYQAKVENVQTYEGDQGSYIVTTGKLVLLESSDENLRLAKNRGIDKIGFRNSLIYDDIGIKPMIVSDDKIEEGDFFYHTSRKQVFECYGFGKSNGNDTLIRKDQFGLPDRSIEVLESDCCKVLACSDQFTDQSLQCIIDENINNWSKVLVKCKKVNTGMAQSGQNMIEYFIDLDHQNCITFFKPFKCPECGCEETRSYHIQNHQGVTHRVTECDDCSYLVGDFGDEPLRERAERVFDIIRDLESDVRIAKESHNSSKEKAVNLLVTFAEWAKNNK